MSNPTQPHGEEPLTPGTSGLYVTEADPREGEAQWCLEQYFRELSDRFEEGFDPSKSAAADPREFLPPNGVFLVAYSEGRPIGCGGIKLTSKDVGYIRRMWVDPSRRGVGLGRALLRALENSARDLGCRRVQLETNRSLTGAIQLYQTAGYREVEPFNDEYDAHHWFEKDLSPARPTTA